MPYRVQGSPYWYITYTDASGARVRRSAGVTSRKEAAAIEAARRLEVHRQRHWGEEPRRLFDELMAGYLRETADKRSHTRDLFSAARLAEHFAGQHLDELDIAAYKASREASAATVAKELVLLSAAVKHARREWGWKIESPVAGRIPKAAKRAPRWLRHDEAEALMSAARRARGPARGEPPLIADFVELALSTGMRRDEIMRLEWARVDLRARLVLFDGHDQKSGVPGSIPINDTALAVLQRRLRFRRKHCPRSPWVFCGADGGRVASVRTAFRQAVKRAGLKRVTPHTLRHTFASWLVQANVPLRTVSELLRHADIRTSMIYAHLAPETARAGAAVFDRILTERSQTGAELGTD